MQKDLPNGKIPVKSPDRFWKNVTHFHKPSTWQPFATSFSTLPDDTIRSQLLSCIEGEDTPAFVRDGGQTVMTG